MKLICFSIILVVVTCFVLVESWPRPSGTQSQGWYPCCCADVNPECPAGCFVCRNYVYSCECSTCSCYSGQIPMAPAPKKSNPKTELLQMLLRSGFGGRRFKRNTDEEDNNSL